MNEQLYKYLQEHWKTCNLPKYQKYFNEWVANLTPDQINGYNQFWLKQS